MLIPAGEVARLMTAEWTSNEETHDFEQSVKFAPGFTITVDYTDIKGRQPQTTRIEVVPGYMGAPLRQVSVDPDARSR
jgi:hypothetical protein